MDGGNRKKRLLESNKWAIIAYANLYRDPETKKMFYGTVQPTADRFNITRTTLYALLDEYDENMEERIIFPDFSPKSRANCGLPSGLTDDVKMNLIDLHNLTEGKSSYKMLR